MLVRRIETSALCAGASAQFGLQPWYWAFPLPVAVGPPQELHWTPLTNRVPSPVSSNEAGLCRARPTTPAKYTLPVVVAVALVVVDAVAVDVAGCVVVLVTGAGDGAGARFVTVLVVVEPHDASASTAPAASRPRPITARSYARGARQAGEVLECGRAVRISRSRSTGSDGCDWTLRPTPCRSLSACGRVADL
jgi:hypothetical protein